MKKLLPLLFLIFNCQNFYAAQDFEVYGKLISQNTDISKKQFITYNYNDERITLLINTIIYPKYPDCLDGKYSLIISSIFATIQDHHITKYECYSRRKGQSDEPHFVDHF